MAVLCGVPFLMVLGNSLLFPVLPAMQAQMHLSRVQASLVVTAFSAPAGVCIPLAGWLADRVGRRRVMVPALLLFGGGALLAGGMAAARGPYGLILAGRAVQGLGAAGMAQMATVLAADLLRGPERPQALGLLEAANGLGKGLSPILGGILGLWAWFAPFFFFAGLSFLQAGATLWAVPESIPASVGQGRPWRILREKGVALGACLGAGAATLYLLFGSLFFLAETLERRWGVAPLPAGMLLAIPVGGLAATSYLGGRLLQGRPEWAKGMVVAGLTLLAAVLGALAAHQQLVYLLAAGSLLGIGAGSVLSALNLLVTSAVPAAKRGVVTSLYGAVRFFGVALGPLSFGLFMPRGAAVLFGGAAGLAAAGALAAATLLHQGRLLDGAGDRPGGRRIA